MKRPFCEEVGESFWDGFDQMVDAVTRIFKPESEEKDDGATPTENTSSTRAKP